MLQDGYWKRELEHNARQLNFWIKVSSKLGGYAEHQVNKFVLYSAIIIRKMLEDEKYAKTAIENANMPMPPLELLKYKVNVIEYPFVGDENFIIERLIPKNYDCKNAKTIEIPMEYVCNQIVHSFVSSIVHNQETSKIYGIAIASDRYKTKQMFLVKVEDWIKALNFCIEKGTI